tara:strand:- start:813 stop:1067 length:255 start_codon:yes stop_codon:yes gene_type:complete
MKVKGKSVYNDETALEFAKSVRGQYIISQALVIASSVLEKYEVEEDITKAEPSNRKDMEYLLRAFPLYRIHEQAIWEDNNEESS